MQLRHLKIKGKKIAYRECGSGDPIVFQHGNPTSSYLWRNIMPALKNYGRCIAIDLIGMGDSDKLDNPGPLSYSYDEHRQYFDAALDALEINDRIIFVLHDWGSALGFDWACRHPDRVRGIAYMEAIVQALSWDEWPEASRKLFQGLRSPAGEKLVLEDNIFVERILPGSIMRNLAENEMHIYRTPFANPGEDRRPTLSWPRQLPIDGEPAEVVAVVQRYADWMQSNDLPKLFINAEPGAILVGANREFCRGWKNQTEVTVPGIHFIQEDSPDKIGAALRDWHQSLPPA
ncbi:MAG: haloalkane dehalogenase [Gammaproteobacteria bacterium]